MQVKNATAALSTASHVGGKASSRANGAEDQGFAALMSALGSPLSEGSSEISGKPVVGEQGCGEDGAEEEVESPLNEMSDLERAAAVTSASPVALGPVPAVVTPEPVDATALVDVTALTAATAPNALDAVPTPVAPTAPQSQVAQTAAGTEAQSRGAQAAASADVVQQAVATAVSADVASQVAADLVSAPSASPSTPLTTSAVQTSSAPASATRTAPSPSDATVVAAHVQATEATSSTVSASVAERASAPAPQRRPVVPARTSIERGHPATSPAPAQAASPAFQFDVRPVTRPVARFAGSHRFEATLPTTQSTAGTAASASSPLPLETFHVEQFAVTPVAGPYAPVNPLATASGGEGAIWDTASLSGARLDMAGRRPRLDALQNLGLEMQGAVRGGLRNAAQGSRAKAGSDASRDARADMAAALAATVAPPQTAEGGVVSSNAPVPLPSLVPEVVRTAAQLSDALKKGNPAASNVVELRLDPPALGAITVRVVEEGGVVNAFVTCANPAMQKVLAAEMTHLSTNLAHHGIALGQVSVGTDGGGAQDFSRKREAGELETAPTGRRAPPASAVAQTRAAPRSALFEGRAVNARA